MTALQIKAKGDRPYLWCPVCEVTARSWGPGAVVTVPQITQAEAQHRAAAHSPTPDYAAIYDGVYENGLG